MFVYLLYNEFRLLVNPSAEIWFVYRTEKPLVWISKIRGILTFEDAYRRSPCEKQFLQKNFANFQKKTIVIMTFMRYNGLVAFIRVFLAVLTQNGLDEDVQHGKL